MHSHAFIKALKECKIYLSSDCFDRNHLNPIAALEVFTDIIFLAIYRVGSAAKKKNNQLILIEIK